MQMHPKTLHASALAVATIAALAFAPAHAAGFQLKENSVKSQGAAFAGTAAKSGDVSVVTNNPALMTTFEGTAVQVDATVIDLNYEFQGTATRPTGQPVSGNNGGDAGDVTPVPALSVIHKLDNGLAFGAMVSAPFGLKTEYDPDFIGRYAALTSDVQIVDLTLSAAIEINEYLSVGLGLTASRAEVTLSKGIDFGALLFPAPLPFAVPGGADGGVEISGSDNGLGWVAGINLRPSDRLSIGLSHRSEVDYEISGTADWTVPGNVRTVFNANPATAPLFVDGDAAADLTTPSITQLGVHWKLTDRFALAATVAETGWSSMREVRVRFDNPDPDAVEPFEWQDSMFYALGAEYALNDRWTLRAGVAHDETPTNRTHRTPRLPDADRVFYSVGATWRITDAFDVNLAYTRIEPRDPQIDTTSGGSHVVGPFDGNANLLGVSGQFRF